MIPERLEPRRKLYGVDCSGAAEADNKIWIAGGVVENGVLLIDLAFAEVGVRRGGPVGIHPFRNMSWTTGGDLGS